MSKAVDQLRREINKAMGGDVLQLGNSSQYKVSYMPTGLLPIDILLNGGIPRGRFVTFTGGYSTLKSYIGLHALASVQRQGGVVALIDTEHAFDPDWAESLGVNTKELIVWPPLDDTNPVTGEEALDMAEVLTINGVDLIVFDSVAAALPQDEQKKRLSGESSQPGRLAALMSKACRKLTAVNRKTGFIWINQLREQIGVTFGNPEKATGGRALPYYSSIIVNIRAAGFITEAVKLFTGDGYTNSKRKIGQSFVAQVQKSKLATPWTDVHFDYSMVRSEIDMVKFLFAQGVEAGVIHKKGNSWSTSRGATGASKDKFLMALSNDSAEIAALEEEIRMYHGLPLLGKSVRGRNGGEGSNRKSSNSVAPKRTLARARAASVSTAVPKRRLSR
jgi:recombination protein RecA